MMLTPIGYLPKVIVGPPEGVVLPGVQEIWSASSCMSEAPEDYIQHWRHNAAALFDTVELALSVVPPEHASKYVVVGYRIWGQRCDEGRLEPHAWSEIKANDVPPDYRSLGFDVVSASCAFDFEHSPLSCNSAAREFTANRYCLFDTLDAAIEAAKAFSTGPWEPGPYYILEVLAPADRITSR